MTETQIQMALALAKCAFPKNGMQGRTAHMLAEQAIYAPLTELTQRQKANLEILFHAYRDKIPEHDRLCECYAAHEWRIAHEDWCDCDTQTNTPDNNSTSRLLFALALVFTIVILAGLLAVMTQ
jgi:hypothetical protein